MKNLPLKFICLFSIFYSSITYSNEKMDLSGSFVLDNKSYHNEEFINEFYIRQAKFKFDFEVEDNVNAEFSLKLDDENKIKWDDYFLDVFLLERYTLLLGKYSLNYGLQNSASSKRLVTMEGVGSINSLMPEANLAVELSDTTQPINWFLTVFQSAKDLDNQDVYGASLRTVYQKQSDNKQWLIGGNIASSNLASQNFSTEFIHPLDIEQFNFESESIKAKNAMQLALEFALVYEQLRVQSEIHLLNVKADPEFDLNDDFADQSFQAGYVQLSYILDKQTSISYKNSKLAKFNTKDWSFFETYFLLESLKQTNTENTSVSTSTGLNYHYSKNLRLMSQLSYQSVNNEMIDSNTNNISFSVRLSANF